MSHLPYIALTNHLIDLGFTIFALLISLKIIFQNNFQSKISKISPTITVFYIYVLIRSIWSLINFGYLLIFFRINSVIYDGRILYILGMFPGIFVTTNSLIELFLCFDRCLCIIFSIKYSKQQQNIFAAISIFGLIFLIIFVIFFGNLIQTIPKLPATECYYFSCLINDEIIINIKIMLLTANIFGGFFLAILMKYYFLQTNNFIVTKLNKVVLTIIFATTIIELVPFLMAQIFLWISGLQLAAYAGPGGITVASINITLSAAIYSRAFKKSVNNVIGITS